MDVSFNPQRGGIIAAMAIGDSYGIGLENDLKGWGFPPTADWQSYPRDFKKTAQSEMTDCAVFLN